MLLEKQDALLAGAGHSWHGEDSAYGRPDQVGIIDVGEGIADDDAISTGSIGRTKHSTQIARFLHALKDDEKRRCGLTPLPPLQLERGERSARLQQAIKGESALFYDGDDTLGRATISYFFVEG